MRSILLTLTASYVYNPQSKIPNKGTLETPIIGDVHRGYEIGLNTACYYMRVSCTDCKEERWQVKSRVKRDHLCKNCAMKLIGLNHRGDKARTWLGGISFEPYTYEFNNELKELVRKRDNYTCQLCGKPQNGKRLACHHIDYNKKHSYLNNLISLCPSKPSETSCHSKTNYNRTYWTEYFNNLLKERNVLTST